MELVPVNDHVSVNGNSPPRTGYGGHLGEALEPQQMLFSWAEFMAGEPSKPKSRKGKPQPATMSMFEWALTLEQEKETIRTKR